MDNGCVDTDISRIDADTLTCLLSGGVCEWLAGSPRLCQSGSDVACRYPGRLASLSWSQPGVPWTSWLCAEGSRKPQSWHLEERLLETVRRRR